MPDRTDERYVLQDYDYILIVASWGNPKEYIPSVYVLEVEKVSNSGKRRIVIDGDKRSYHSSTAAIRDVLRKIGISNENIEMLIFYQDTILIDYIEEMFDLGKQKEIEKSEIKEKLLGRLYEEVRDVIKELGVKDHKDYERFVRFVPGVITRVEGGYIYSWRYEHCYDLLLGAITLYTYEKLNEIPKEARKIAILLDTTHGINYFVTALKEGVLRASMLYAFNRFIESVDTDKSTDKSLEEFTIYHYNSDPISEPDSNSKSVKCTPSLKIHMLDKIAIVKNGRVLLNTLFTEIEEHVRREDPRAIENELSIYWGGVEWDKIINALILFSRGLLIWSLRLSHEISKIPDIKELEGAIDKLKLKIDVSRNVNRTEYKLSYTPSNRVPMRNVVEYAILVNMLKDLGNKIMYKNDTNNFIVNTMKNLLKEIGTEITKCSKDLYNELQGFVEGNRKYMCLNIEKLMEVLGKICASPYSDIIENEISEIKEYLNKKKETLWKPCSEGAPIYVEPRTRSTYMIEDSNVRIIISTPMNLDKRNVYAHGGLAYGLPWLAIHLIEKNSEKNNSSVLCLGEPDKVSNLVSNEQC